MRAIEFILEEKVGRLSKRQQSATVGLNKFRDKNSLDRTYELNRVMMAAAATDGTFVPEIDSESWVGRENVSAPYTKEEQNILKMAYRAVGSKYTDLNRGDLDSEELLPAVNVHSPVKGFKGYPR